ncbi:MAG TPA: DUF4266 domain-containing protein [Polyangiaceae bacterium]|nr:DUF4266 domain-containing protein [Polyangiaceae bacterium]
MTARRGLAALGISVVVSACAHVPAYDRGKLAHPTMQAGYEESPGVLHMRAVQEGATGGEVNASSGCGCN